MELLELILLLLGAVLASTVAGQLLPRIALPLAQIIIGAVIAVFVRGGGFVVDSELFLVLLIAPLLFDESRNADKGALWENRGSILSLAVGLVLALVLAVGFTLHAIEPSIPLAAAFALGAALGPTDAAAVASLSKDVSLSKRQRSLLSGEALINDASGVVSFQFAIAAATTGAFSLMDAGRSFLISFFGGLTLGAVLGVAAIVCTGIIHRRGCETLAAHVTFELFTPFVVYLLAERMEVSGILAVVGAGLVMSFVPHQMDSEGTRISIASSAVWKVLEFVANGVVFVMLGMELPAAILPGWTGSEMHTPLIAGAAVAITAVLVAVRFAWVLFMEACRREGETGRPQGFSAVLARNALVTTLAGPKGAVTLSVVFTIPHALASGAAFPYRETIICIASVVVLLTLLLANFLMPVVAPAKDEAIERETRGVYADILQGVRDKLSAQAGTPTNEGRAAAAAVRSYDARLEQLRKSIVSDVCVRGLCQQVFDVQRGHVEQALRSGRVDAVFAQHCMDQLERMTRMIERHGGMRCRINPLNALLRGLHGARSRARNVTGTQNQENRSAFVLELEQCAVDYLRPIAEQAATSPEEGERAEAARMLIAEHEAAIENLRLRVDHQTMGQAIETNDPEANAMRQDRGPEAAKRRQAARRAERKVAHGTMDRANDLYAQALRWELEGISQALESGVIGKKAAQDMREEVYLLQMGLAENQR